MYPKAAPQRFNAFSSIVSNTGARSPGDELITCNTSAVAVCCSSASRVSVNNRAFSIAITACAAKFSTSAMCFSENGRGSCLKMRIAPSSASPLCSATRKPVRIPARVCAYATVPGAVARSSSRTIFSPLAMRASDGEGTGSGRLCNHSTYSSVAPWTAAARKRLPSYVHRIPDAASHNRVAFSSIAFQTGARLPGELLMTPNTSAVAVCWSSASRVSVKSRAFSIAITACAAKFCNSAICLSVKGRTSLRYRAKPPSKTSLLRKATHSVVRAPIISTSFSREATPERYASVSTTSGI